MPFTYTLIKSQTPKYHYSVKKSNPTGFFFSKKQPLREVEEVLIYYKKAGTYNPQMIGDVIRHMPKTTGNCGQNYYNGRNKPQPAKTYKGYFPTTLLHNNLKRRGGKSVCDELITYFIKTYSNENDTILDMTCCNDVVGNLCKELKRNFIGIDINLKDELL